MSGNFLWILSGDPSFDPLSTKIKKLKIPYQAGMMIFIQFILCNTSHKTVKSHQFF